MEYSLQICDYNLTLIKGLCGNERRRRGLLSLPILRESNIAHRQSHHMDLEIPAANLGVQRDISCVRGDIVTEIL
jgi:hypothetical protein